MLIRRTPRDLRALALLGTVAFGVCGPLRAQSALSQDIRRTEAQPRAIWSVEWNPEFTQGRYGGPTNIESLEQFVRLRWRQGPWRAALGTGHLTERDGMAPESLISGASSNPSNNTYFRGWEDLNVSLGHVWSEPGHPWSASLTGQLTVPTGHPDLRVRRTEPELNGTLRWRLSRDWSSSITLGHRWTAAGATNPTRNTVLTRMAAVWSMTQGTALDASFTRRTARHPGDPDVREATLGLFFDVTPSFGWGLYGIVGFSDNSPKNGAGLSITWWP